MRVVNVVEIEGNAVKDITSLAIYEEQLSSEVVETAEELFEKKMVEMRSNVTEEQIEEAKANGYFKIHNQSVCLTWSDI